MLGKKVSDLIRDDVRIAENGDVTGTLLYVSEYTEFSSNPEERSGNFFPIYLDKDGSQLITVKDGVTRTQNMPDDKLLVIRLNSENTTVKISVDDAEITTLNFKTATIECPVGKDAVTIPASHDFGTECGDAKDMCSDASVAWDGIKGAVTGTFYKQNKASKYQCPTIINDYYSGKQITVNVTTDTTDDTLEWHSILGEDEETAKNATLTVKQGENVLAELTFLEAEFKDEAAPEN